jgi:DNA (cytosine-5)-methyltransferase 1
MTLMLDIRSLRQAQGVKQRDLALTVGISVNHLMRLERGIAAPEKTLLAELCQALNIVPSSVAMEHGLVTARQCGEGYVTARPAAAEYRKRTAKIKPKLRPVLDLFCGVGGFSYGFELTGQFQVAAGIDLLGDRLDTFSINHPAANAYGQDIRSVATKSIDDENPRPFVIVGGPPCQGFSSLRPFRNVEWNDPRNNLAEEFVRFIEYLKPEWVVFENVVGLLTHEKGKTLQSVVSAFDSAGYRTSARVLNAAYYGLPQRRERLIIVGSRKGKPFKWPQPTHWIEHRSMAGSTDMLIRPEGGLFSAHLPKAVTVSEAISDLPPIRAGEQATVYNDLVATTDYQKFIRNGADILALHESTNHSSAMLEIIRHSGANINALPAGLVTSGFSSCYSRLAADEPSTTITVNFVHPASNRCIHPHQNRALTPREGARIQGFFDTFGFRGSRSQIVKQIGNAVPPLLGRVIAQSLLESD